MSEERIPIINSVVSPLAFLTLALLVSEATFLALLLTDIKDVYVGIGALVVFIVFLIVIVLLVVVAPDALLGRSAINETHAENFALKVVNAFDGPIRNNPRDEQLEAWQTATSFFEPTDDDEQGYAKFKAVIARELGQFYRARFRVSE